MIGRRLPDMGWPAHLPEDLRDGDYWKVLDCPSVLAHGWFVYYGGARTIPLHHVDEHEDGTISVVPQPENPNSLLLGPGGWHGWIRHGVWETC